MQCTTKSGSCAQKEDGLGLSGKKSQKRGNYYTQNKCKAANYPPVNTKHSTLLRWNDIVFK